MHIIITSSVVFQVALADKNQVLQEFWKLTEVMFSSQFSPEGWSETADTLSIDKSQRKPVISTALTHRPFQLPLQATLHLRSGQTSPFRTASDFSRGISGGSVVMSSCPALCGGVLSPWSFLDKPLEGRNRTEPFQTTTFDANSNLSFILLQWLWRRETEFFFLLFF